jgi:hypothetical protein
MNEFFLVQFFFYQSLTTTPNKILAFSKIYYFNFIFLERNICGLEKSHLLSYPTQDILFFELKKTQFETTLKFCIIFLIFCVTLTVHDEHELYSTFSKPLPHEAEHCKCEMSQYSYAC